MNYQDELIQIENRIDKILSNNYELGNELNEYNETSKVGSSEDKLKDQSCSASFNFTTMECRDSYDERPESENKEKLGSDEWYVEWIENSFDPSAQESDSSGSHIAKKQQLQENEIDSITEEESTGNSFLEDDFLSVGKHDKDKYDKDDSVDNGNSIRECDHDENSFFSYEFQEDEEAIHLINEVLDMEELSDFESNLFSESLEKNMDCADELEYDIDVRDAVLSISSMEKRDRMFNSLTRQHDHLFEFKEQNYEQTKASYQVVSEPIASELSQKMREETSSSRNNRLQKDIEEYVGERYPRDSWKKCPLNSSKQSQTRACDRLYNLAMKKRESDNKRRKMKEESELLTSSKSFHSSQHGKKYKSSKPVYERLYSLAPKRPRKVKISQERRWK